MGDTNPLQDRIERLEASVEELATLNEIATTIGSSKSLEDINRTIVELVIKKIGASQGAVFLLPEQEEDTLRTMVRVKAQSVEESSARFGTIATGRVIKLGKPLNISIGNDPDGFLRHASDGVRSALTIPLKSRGRFIGTISVFNKREADSFTMADQRFLTIVGAQSAQVIENARLLKSEVQFTSLKKELSLASDIQDSFMPTDFLSPTGYDIHALNVQADEIGGDSFDVIPMGNDSLLLNLGDVCGHGVPAALMMAMLQTTIRAQLDISQGKIDNLGDFAQGISNYFCKNTEPGNFATMFMAILSFNTHTIEYISAGHPPALLCDASGSISQLTDGGPPLGVLLDAPFYSGKTEFPSGGRLLLYSDGVTELEDVTEEQYESERLEEFVKANIASESQKFCSELRVELDRYRGEAIPDDDITLFSIRRND